MRLLSACLLVAVTLGCRSSGVTVEERSGEGWRPVAYRLASMESRRDGYLTASTFRLIGGDGAELRLVLNVAVNPTARLESGTWSASSRSGEVAGDVMPIQVEFLGGQGSGASVGGRFLLQEGGKARYRVYLPPTAPTPTYDQ
ncbi:MAG: hypothetical protein PVF51_00965 [Nitrospirota bacterium]|jgi:hypothetical protein